MSGRVSYFLHPPGCSQNALLLLITRNYRSLRSAGGVLIGQAGQLFQPHNPQGYREIPWGGGVCVMIDRVLI